MNITLTKADLKAQGSSGGILDSQSPLVPGPEHVRSSSGATLARVKLLTIPRTVHTQGHTYAAN